MTRATESSHGVSISRSLNEEEVGDVREALEGIGIAMDDRLPTRARGYSQGELADPRGLVAGLR